MGDVPKIFLSYSHEDRGRADAVKMLLELGGARVFMDWRSIAPGTQWEPALMKALTGCNILCVFWSAAAQRSKWVRAEYMTFSRAFPDRPCIPLRADETPLPPVLARRQAPPEFLALANQFLALRRDLTARGISRRETSRIVQQRLVQIGVQLDDAQRRKLLGLFATGLSLGVLLAPLSKSLKLAALLAGIIASISLIWRPCSSDQPRPRPEAHRERPVAAPRAAARSSLSPASPAEDAMAPPATDPGGDGAARCTGSADRPGCSGVEPPRPAGPASAPAGVPKQAAAPDRAPGSRVASSSSDGPIRPAVCVQNSTTRPVRFTLGAGTRQEPAVLQPGRRLRYRGDGEPQEFTIAFDTNLAAGYTERVFRVPATPLHEEPDDCQDAATYEFTAAGTSIGLRPMKWTPGSEHPFLPHVVAEQVQDRWTCAPNYVWADPASASDLRCVPRAIATAAPPADGIDQAELVGPDDAVRGEPVAILRARSVLERGNTPQGIQLLVHGSGTLQRWDYAGARMRKDGFRLWYIYSWRSNLSEDNARTELAFDLDGDGVIQRCVVGRDSSFIPAFYEAQLALQLMKDQMRNDRDLQQVPAIARAIDDADAARLMVLLLNARKISLLVRRQ